MPGSAPRPQSGAWAARGGPVWSWRGPQGAALPRGKLPGARPATPRPWHRALPATFPKAPRSLYSATCVAPATAARCRAPGGALFVVRTQRGAPGDAPAASRTQRCALSSAHTAELPISQSPALRLQYCPPSVAHPAEYAQRRTPSGGRSQRRGSSGAPPAARPASGAVPVAPPEGARIQRRAPSIARYLPYVVKHTWVTLACALGAVISSPGTCCSKSVWLGRILRCLLPMALRAFRNDTQDDTSAAGSNDFLLP